MNTQALQEQAAHAAAEYDSLLHRMDEITDLMLSALAASDTDSALKLLEARSGVCEEITACSRSLDSLMSRLDSCGPGLDALLRRVQENLTNLSQKQASCEAMMASGLNDCRSELMSLRQQRGLKQAYLPSRQAKKAVYLDSKR